MQSKPEHLRGMWLYSTIVERSQERLAGNKVDNLVIDVIIAAAGNASHKNVNEQSVFPGRSGKATS
ncbi:hypothetical protein CUN67_26050 (plasmid) [Pantoea cypripedii]|uniref:Uncharacterized protein n=1 Tax=Pantoea cypripedii TaxID=55209 RepID=A0A6B9GFH0_PANCY|nr:hypothetical protein CUN67_26050 [Pantoea cypripedii]